jgi:hypothetical protein
MLRIFLATFVLLIILTAGSSGANKPRRVALVIGNSAYIKTPELANPRNDARAVAEALAGLDFEVIEGFDLSKSDFDKRVLAFARKLKGADVGLFYYAGHGLQVNGRNFLVPVDAELEDEAALDFSMVELNTVLKQMERQPRTNLIFLDACRDNPLARNLSRSMGTRGGSVGKGLAGTSTGIGTMIVFATQPGNVAKDGTGDNSPFTTALLEFINSPGLNISTMMQRVRRSVIKATGGEQVPWNHSSLTGPFIFKPKVLQPSGMNDGGGGINVEGIYWQTIMDKEDASLFKEYLKDYPNGRFVRIAKLLIKRYEPPKKQVIVRAAPRKTNVKSKPLIDQDFLFQCVKKEFFSKGLEELQSQSIKAFVNDWDSRPKSKDLRWLAYILATAYHETNLKPVREGYKETDAEARKHLKWLKKNVMKFITYDKPDPVTGEVYYGRGFAMLTRADNYKKIGKVIGMGDRLYKNPDLALKPDIAAKILTTGMISGAFRYKHRERDIIKRARNFLSRRNTLGPQKLSLFFNSTQSDWVGARNIINGDLRRNGPRVAKKARKFFGCLRLKEQP